MNKRIIKSNDDAAGGASFNTVLYTGDGTTQSITDVGFQPDFVWIKERTSTGWHILTDSLRGANKVIYSNDSYNEESLTNVMNSFDSNGFSVGYNAAYSDVFSNRSSQDYVAWCWKAGGAAVTNTDGTITSQVSANVDAGFSIVGFTIPSSGSPVTVGHGLGIAPKVVIVKTREKTGSWFVYTEMTGADKEAYLELTNAWGVDLNRWNNTSPTSDVLTLGTSWLNATYSGTAIAYCFAEVAGFSKFGSYSGTGTTSGNIVSTGFEVAFLLVKKATSSADDWFIFDNKRTPIGEAYIRPNSSSAELDYGGDFMRIDATDGFQPIWSSPAINASGETYIYMAFANQF